MYPKAFLFALFVCGVAFAPCRGQGEQDTRNDPRDGPNLEEVRAEVSNLERVFAKHVRDNNCGAIINMYDPDFMLIGRDSKLHGLEAIQKTLGWLEGVGELNPTTISVSPLGRDGKFVFEHFSGIAYDKEGNLMENGEGFAIWKRYPDGLKVFMEIYDEKL